MAADSPPRNRRKGGHFGERQSNPKADLPRWPATRVSVTVLPPRALGVAFSYLPIQKGSRTLTYGSLFGIFTPVAIFAYSLVFTPYRAHTDAPIDYCLWAEDGKRRFESIAYGENGHHFLGETTFHLLNNARTYSTVLGSQSSHPVALVH